MRCVWATGCGGYVQSGGVSANGLHGLCLSGCSLTVSAIAVASNGPWAVRPLRKSNSNHTQNPLVCC